MPGHIYRNSYDADGNTYDHYFVSGQTSTHSYANLRVKSNNSYYVLRFGGDGAFTWNGNNVIHSGNYASYALKNYGADNSRPNGTTFTLPGGANPVSMRSNATSGADIGIFYLSDDNAFICNSSDNAYLFATFDTDKTADFSSASNAAFAVLSNHEGILVKGAINSSVSTSTHLAGNQGTAIINSTASAGYNMLAKMNSTNGVFTLGMYSTAFNLYYTKKSVIDAGTNSTTYGATLLDESGNSSFPGLVSTKSLSVVNDSCNNSTDALAYFRHRSGNDWAIIVDKTDSYSYGVDIRCGGEYALKVGSGKTRLVGATMIGSDTSPETTLDINGIQQIYQRGNDNTAFKDLLLLKQQNSTEDADQSWTSSKPTFGIGFRRYWTSGSSPYGETTCAGIYATIASSWRGGLVFRTKNNQTQGGTHDTTALRLRPDGHAIFGSSIETNGPIYTSQPSSGRRHGIIGTYDPNRAAAIWSMGSSYQIAADGTTFGNLYGAAYAYFGSGYTFGSGYSEGHSFVWCQNGSPYVALGNGIWTGGGLTVNGNQTLYGLTSTCNAGNSASYTNAAMQIREYNFGGAQTDTWGNAPRLAWHWSGRVQAQIGLASDNHLYISEDGSFGSPQLIIHAGNIGSQSVNYATTAGSASTATTAGTAGKLSLVSCYNGTSNNDLWSTIKSSNSSYLGTATVYEVYNDGGPTTYGHVLDIVTVHSNHWQSQLWFDAGKGGRLRYRNKDYNNNSWGSWGEVAWTSDIPSVGNGTVTITQNGSNVGSFTMNQSGDTTIALTDTDTNTNYYPIRSYASGLQISSYSGSTNCQLWVPYATSSQAGVVSTSTQTFAGEKTFSSVMTASDGIKLGSYGKIGYGSLDSTYTESVPSVTDSYGIWIGTKGTSSTSLESSGMAITGDTVYFWSPHDKPMYYFDSDTTSYPNTNYYVHEVLNTATGLGKKGLLSAYSFYKTPGGTSITGTAGLSGVSISSSRPRAGKYTLTITNNRAVPIVIHAPVLTPIISDYGGGSCYRSAYTELYSDNTYRFPYSLSAGSSITIAFGCGYIHTQGSWSTGDFTKSVDDVGFSGILPISH